MKRVLPLIMLRLLPMAAGALCTGRIVEERDHHWDRDHHEEVEVRPEHHDDH
jgi:hypothetical protein